MNPQTRRRILSAIFTFLILFLGMMIYQNLSDEKASTISSRVPKQDIRPVEVTFFEKINTNYFIEIDGRLNAFEVVSLFSEVTGRLQPTGKKFKEGTYYRKGELIFKIDNTDAQYNLLAQRSNLLNSITQIMPDLKFDYPEAFKEWKNYLDQFDIEDHIAPLPEIKDQQVRYYVAGKNIYNLYYTIKSLEDRLADYRIYAPFNGIVTEANTNEGALVSPGTNLGTFIHTSQFELEAPVPLSDLKYIKQGQQVSLKSEALGKEWAGTISRISNIIDPTTQNLPIYIRVSGDGLSEGMYLKGEIMATEITDVAAVPEDLIIEQSKVFVVRDSIVTKKQLEVMNRKNGIYYVRGLEPEDSVIAGSLNGIFDGQKVIVKNSSKS